MVVGNSERYSRIDLSDYTLHKVLLPVALWGTGGRRERRGEKFPWGQSCEKEAEQQRNISLPVSPNKATAGCCRLRSSFLPPEWHFKVF